MGLFNLFKPKKQVQVATELGTFTLMNSKTPIWAAQKGSQHLSVRGTSTAPDPDQLQFLKQMDKELEKLDAAIASKFIDFFIEAGSQAAFTHWNQRFHLIAIAIDAIVNNKVSWNITFEDQQDGFTHFNLYIQDGQPTDFSIDT